MVCDRNGGLADNASAYMAVKMPLVLRESYRLTAGKVRARKTNVNRIAEIGGCAMTNQEKALEVAEGWFNGCLGYDDADQKQQDIDELAPMIEAALNTQMEELMLHNITAYTMFTGIQLQGK